MRTVALDLGAKTIAYCEVAAGQVVHRASLGSVAALEAFLGAGTAPARVAIEACREAWFVHAQLTSWGHEVLIVDTTRSRQLGIGQHGRKNDRVDAEVLARALERGGIPLAHVLSPHRQELRRQLNVRRALVETRAQYVTTMRGLARELGHKLPACDAENFVARMAKSAVNVEVRGVIAPLLSTLEALDKQLTHVEQGLAKLSGQEPIVALLMTVPGVGRIVAASFVSVIDDAKRFDCAHQVESYLGLVPSEDSTGGKRRLGSISKKGNSYVRALLVQSAWVILRLPARGDPLQCWARAIVARRGKRIAVVALARRLVGVLWAMWRDGTAYNAEHAARTGSRGLKAAAQDLERRAAALERPEVRRDTPQPAPTTEVTASP